MRESRYKFFFYCSKGGREILLDLASPRPPLIGEFASVVLARSRSFDTGQKAINCQDRAKVNRWCCCWTVPGALGKFMRWGMYSVPRFRARDLVGCQLRYGQSVATQLIRNFPSNGKKQKRTSGTLIFPPFFSEARHFCQIVRVSDLLKPRKDPINGGEM